MRHTLRNALRAARADPAHAARAALHSIFLEVSTNPKASSLVLFGSFDAGPTARERFNASLVGFESLFATTAVEEGRCQIDPMLQKALARAQVAGMTRVARTTLLFRMPGALLGLVDDLAAWMTSICTQSASAPRVHVSDRDLARLRLLWPVQNRDPSVRGRLRAVTMRIALRDGYGALTLSQLRKEAEVSRRQFEAEFSDLDACFLDAVEHLAISASEGAGNIAGGTHDWKEWPMSAALLCELGAAESALARLALVDIYSAGSSGLYAKEHLISRATSRLRATIPTNQRPPLLFTEASIAGAWSVANGEFASRRRVTPQDMTGPVAILIAHAVETH